MSWRECETTSFPPASLYSYRVKKINSSKEEDVITIKACQLRRAKGVYTREKNRLLLKQFTEQKQKVWVIKVSLNICYQSYKLFVTIEG